MHGLLMSACGDTQVAETFTGFGDHISNEALNASYYAEEFDKFLHKLQDPVAVRPILTTLLRMMQVPALIGCHNKAQQVLMKCVGELAGQVSEADQADGLRSVLPICRSRQELHSSPTAPACSAPTWALWRPPQRE